MKHTKPAGIIPGLILHRLRRARKPLTVAEIMERLTSEPVHPAIRGIEPANLYRRVTGNLVHLERRGEIVTLRPIGRPRKHNRKRCLYRVA